MIYLLSEFDRTVQTKDWTTVPTFPAPGEMGSDEVHWVNPETFFDQLPEVLATVSGCRVRRRSMPRSRRCWTPPGQTRRSSRR